MCAGMQAGPSNNKPPMVPRLGLKLDLSSSAGPASDRAALAAFDFPTDAGSRDVSTSLMIRS